jgi:hypothetical protein
VLLLLLLLQLLYNLASAMRWQQCAGSSKVDRVAGIACLALRVDAVEHADAGQLSGIGVDKARAATGVAVACRDRGRNRGHFAEPPRRISIRRGHRADTSTQQQQYPVALPLHPEVNLHYRL